MDVRIDSRSIVTLRANGYNLPYSLIVTVTAHKKVSLARTEFTPPG